MARESLARCPHQAEAYSILVFGILQEEQYVPHPADIAAAGLSPRDATPLAIARKLASLSIAMRPRRKGITPCRWWIGEIRKAKKRGMGPYADWNSTQGIADVPSSWCFRCATCIGSKKRVR